VHDWDGYCQGNVPSASFHALQVNYAYSFQRTKESAE
jgi:hypothetical protein